MDILFDPNIAYLLVVSTFLLLWSSYATPGTGILEAAALIGLILSGWAMFILPINLWALGLLLLVIFPVAAYRFTQRTGFLVLAILMLEIGSVFIFAGEGWRPIVNPLLAIVVSAGTGFYYWLSTTKIIEAERSPLAHNPDALIGAQGEARTAIHHEGTIYIDGELWSARSEQPVPNGSPVRVTAREGLVLVVEESKQAASS
jgi:membrane-bound serine protease (ClpP class)